jgi:hypothetical protein
MDARQIMQSAAQRGDDAKIAAASAQRPEQLLVLLFTGGHEAAVREHHLRFDQIVERKPKTSDQRSIAAAERQACHADAGGRAADQGETERVGDGNDVGGPRAARDQGRSAVRRHNDVSHAAEINHETVVQRAAGPVMTAAAHRQRELEIARGANGRLDVLRPPAVDRGGGRDAGLLRPDRYRRCVAIFAPASRRVRAASGSNRLFRVITSVMALSVLEGASKARAQPAGLRKREPWFVKILAVLNDGQVSSDGETPWTRRTHRDR